MLRMTPPRSFRTRTPWRQPRNVPSTLTLCTRRHVSSVIVSIEAIAMTPALLTRMSSLPCCAATPSTTRCHARSSVTSSCLKARPGASTRARPPAEGSRSAMITWAPSRAKRRAMANPIPPAPPVTNAVLPSRRCSIATSHRDAGLLEGEVHRDLGIEDLRHRTVLLGRAGQLLEPVPFNPRHPRTQGQRRLRDPKALALFLQGDSSLGGEFGRGEAGTLELKGQRHRETAGVSRGDQLLRVGSRLALKAGLERVGRVGQDA